MEPNPDFLTDLKAASGGKGVILACEAGGSTKPTPSFQFGKSSRSLSAAYRCPLRARVSVLANTVPMHSCLGEKLNAGYESQSPREPERGMFEVASLDP